MARVRLAAACPAALAALLAGLGLAGLGLAGPAAPAEASTGRGDAVPAVPTSVVTSTGVYASVPMGHLDQRLNTFWQLFHLAPGATHWSNDASALGVATNGGLLLAPSPAGGLVVGIRPTYLLTYSALADTTNGRSWAPEEPLNGVAEGLADEGGALVALVSSRSGGSVERSSGSGWRALATGSSLAASSATRSCGVSRLTAVAATASDTAIVGVACDKPGVVGIYALGAGGVRSLAVVGAARSASATVLSLRTSGDQLVALVELNGRRSSSLAVASGVGTLSLGATRSVPAGASLVSYGPDGSNGEFALFSRKGASTLVAGGAALGGWHTLASPPPHTATVAFSRTGRVDAFAVDDTVMTDWTLAPGARRFTKDQVFHVEIEFGSSGGG